MNAPIWVAYLLLSIVAISVIANFGLLYQKRSGKMLRSSFLFSQFYLVALLGVAPRLWWLALLLFLADPSSWLLFGLLLKRKPEA